MPPLSPRDQERKRKIIADGIAFFASHGREDVTTARFAAAIGVSAQSFKRLFCDIEHLLGEVMGDHLRAVTAALMLVPEDAPDTFEQRRAIYRQCTREATGEFTPVHTILVRLAATLPDDERNPVEAMHHAVGKLLAGDLGDDALDLLDRPNLRLRDAELILARQAERWASEGAGAAAGPRMPRWLERIEGQARAEDARREASCARFRAIIAQHEAAAAQWRPPVREAGSVWEAGPVREAALVQEAGPMQDAALVQDAAPVQVAAPAGRRDLPDLWSAVPASPHYH